MRALIVCGLLLTAAGCRRPTATPRAEVANSEAVKLLKSIDNPYFVIYHPAVDLAKRPAPPKPAGR